MPISIGEWDVSMLVHEVLAYKRLWPYFRIHFFVVTIRKIRTKLRGIKCSCFIIYYLKLCACVPMCLCYLCGVQLPEETRRGLLELELQAFVSHRVGAEHQIQVLCKTKSNRWAVSPASTTSLTFVANMLVSHRFLIIQLSGFKVKSRCQVIYTYIYIYSR